MSESLDIRELLKSAVAGEPIKLEGPKTTRSLRYRHSALASPAAELAILDTLRLPDGTALDFDGRLKEAGIESLSPASLEIFQINLGKLCNMTCRHCHVDAGPDRWDAMMTRDTVDDCLAALDRSGAHTVDITGGAPELHPDFRYLVDECVGRGKHVIDRCNLSVLLVGKCRDLPEWLAERGVEIVASLPHYRKRNTDAQRGEGAFEKSIEAMLRLNEVGYGKGDPRLVLTLMSNPAGAFLSPNQGSVENEWRTALERDQGVSFDRLFALNNMPISRFLEWLVESGNLQEYMELLSRSFNPAAVEGLMCRNTISISWDGRVFDCDFNQMLDLEAEPVEGSPHIDQFDLDAWQQRRVVTRSHCFGCTGGSGSSCGGATA